MGLLKKAIQLSKLSDAKIMLKIYNKEDQSLIEYFSHNESDFDQLNKTSYHIQ